jgi:SAM-dependent methyltransferase
MNSDKPANADIPRDAFGEYAKWYNAFNRQKNYVAEIDYLLHAIARHQPRPGLNLPGRISPWLDIGCGSGEHAAALAARGMLVEGVDISAEMLAAARRAHSALIFHLGAAESFRLTQKFDTASMLFHVASYLTSDDAVEKTMTNIAAHLVPGGLFVFDFWHTGGVIHDPPAARIRETVVDGQRLFRLTHVEQDLARQMINIRFEFRRDSATGPVIHEEHHAMRHFSSAHLHTVLDRAGFEVMACEGWMTGQPLETQDWYGVIFARLSNSDSAH